MAGSLQFPRTIVTMILPALLGAWVGKKKGNMPKAIAWAGILSAIPMLLMGFATDAMNIILIYFIPLTVTGVAECFRGVSIMSAAQAQLSVEDIGIGTALITFANSVVASFAAAIYGLVYNTALGTDVNNVEHITRGVNNVFLTAGIITLIATILAIVWVRPVLNKEKAE